jgi:hypothetical protein
VQTVIDSYQQQLKEMKQTVNDINRATGGARPGLTQYSAEEVDEARFTMGQPDRISTFRTEMLDMNTMNPSNNPMVGLS